MNYWIFLNKRLKQSDKLRFNYIMQKQAELEKRIEALEKAE